MDDYESTWTRTSARSSLAFCVAYRERVHTFEEPRCRSASTRTW